MRSSSYTLTAHCARNTLCVQTARWREYDTVFHSFTMCVLNKYTCMGKFRFCMALHYLFMNLNPIVCSINSFITSYYIICRTCFPNLTCLLIGGGTTGAQGARAPLKLSARGASTTSGVSYVVPMRMRQYYALLPLHEKNAHSYT